MSHSTHVGFSCPDAFPRAVALECGGEFSARVASEDSTLSKSGT